MVFARVRHIRAIQRVGLGVTLTFPYRLEGRCVPDDETYWLIIKMSVGPKLLSETCLFISPFLTK